MTQTHTPGPWEDNGAGLIYGQVQGDDDEAPFVADVCNNGGAGIYSEQEKINARLIAAAPELLEALDNLAEHIDSKSGDFAMRAHFLKEAFAAIAKARGNA